MLKTKRKEIITTNWNTEKWKAVNSKRVGHLCYHNIWILFNMPFYIIECRTWYLKFTYIELIERIARDWSRVTQKLYTDIKLTDN